MGVSLYAVVMGKETGPERFRDNLPKVTQESEAAPWTDPGPIVLVSLNLNVRECSSGLSRADSLPDRLLERLWHP